MIRSASHSSYPIGADDPRDEMTEAIVVAEQSRAFVDVVTDGQVRWSGPLSQVAARLDGVDLEGEADWPDRRIHDRRPVLRGDIRRRAAIAVEGYRAASAVTPKPVKVSLPGPATFVRLADDRHYGDRGRALRAVAAVLAEEVRDLGAAGCRWFQLDEPLLTGAPEEIAACTEVFGAAPAGSVTLLFAPPLADRLADLPGTHLGLDVTEAASLEILAHLPPGRGIALGIFDARLEDAEDVDAAAGRLAPWRGHLEGRDLLVGPNAGLAGLPRDAAFEKLLHARYLAEHLRRAWSPSGSPR